MRRRSPSETLRESTPSAVVTPDFLVFLLKTEAPERGCPSASMTRILMGGGGSKSLFLTGLDRPEITVGLREIITALSIIENFNAWSLNNEERKASNSIFSAFTEI